MRLNNFSWNIFKILWWMLLLVFQIQGHSQAEQLKILTSEEPPLSFLENQEATGIVTDIVKEILRRTETKTSIEVFPWIRAYRTGLMESDVVLFTTARTESREALWHWVGPVVERRWVLVARRVSEIKVNSLEDARRVKLIAVVRGDARAKFLQDNGVKVYLLNTLQQAFAMLARGRVDLIATSEMDIPIAATKIGFESGDFRIVYTLRKIHSYIAISKGTQLSTVHRWQLAFKNLKKDGTFNKIVNRWANTFKIPLTGENGIIEMRASN